MKNIYMEEFLVKTKTEDTKAKYIKRSLQLVNRIKKELNVTDLDPRQIVVWLKDYKSNINPQTWRQYKNAIIYFLETTGLFEDQASIEAIEYLKGINSDGTARHTGKTSSLKLKKITIEDWQKLDDYLKSKDRKWHDELRVWLRASIVTGLRPIEWKNTELVRDGINYSLRIKNAKNTNGRAHGPTRTLLLTYVTQDDLIKIKTHLNNIKTFVGMDEYEFFYNGCYIALYKACRKCWPKRKRHITLYSTRHQFSANAKSSGMSKVEVAALMGHAVDTTAGEHYGRKQAGNEGLAVEPIKEDVSRVRHVDNDFVINKEENF
jgi:hypothetical protein